MPLTVHMTDDSRCSAQASRSDPQRVIPKMMGGVTLVSAPTNYWCPPFPGSLDPRMSVLLKLTSERRLGSTRCIGPGVSLQAQTGTHPAPVASSQMGPPQTCPPLLADFSELCSSRAQEEGVAGQGPRLLYPGILQSLLVNKGCYQMLCRPREPGGPSAKATNLQNSW